jgi:hypothetical protein
LARGDGKPSRLGSLSEVAVLGAMLAIFSAWSSPRALEDLPIPLPERTPASAKDNSAGNAPALDLAPRIASYSLDATLDAEAHRISGKGTITLENHSRAELTEVYLHLYLNAFKNNQTLFLRSPFTRGRSGDSATDWGYCKIERLTQDGTDIWSERIFEEPNDETDVRVPLKTPVPPGATLLLDVAFTSQLPPIVERTGYSQDYQALPRIH